MALACPVCDRHQADAEHLANHLAIMASLHGDDHESWLVANSPDWTDLTPEELGAVVRTHAEKVSDPRSDTELTEDAPKFDLGSGRDGEFDPAGRRMDRETKRILSEARELTERMIDAGEDDTPKES